jgi:hypothetical protein
MFFFFFLPLSQIHYIPFYRAYHARRKSVGRLGTSMVEEIEGGI